jgi:hypothetical protein
MSLERKEALVSYLFENQKALNLKWLAESAGIAANFHQMVRGNRKLPDEFVEPIYQVLVGVGISFDQSDDSTPVMPKEVPADCLVFYPTPGGMKIKGLGLEYTRTKDSYETKINGKEVNEPKLTSNLIMVDRMAEGTFKLLKS